MIVLFYNCSGYSFDRPRVSELSRSCIDLLSRPKDQDKLLYKIVSKALASDRLNKFYSDKHILLTGGNRGIGKNIAALLVALGANITIIGRDQKSLKRVKVALNKLRPDPDQQVIEVAAIDLLDYVKLTEYINQINTKTPIDVLINNAGVQEARALEEMTQEQIIRVNRINSEAPQIITKIVFDAASNSLQNIGFVSSLAAIAAVQGYQSYGASKAAIVQFADGLRHEFKTTGRLISVSVILPGPTATKMLKENAKLPIITQAVEATVVPIDPMIVAVSLLTGMAKGKFKLYPDLATRLQANFLNVNERVRHLVLDTVFYLSRIKNERP